MKMTEIKVKQNVLNELNFFTFKFTFGICPKNYIFEVKMKLEGDIYWCKVIKMSVVCLQTTVFLDWLIETSCYAAEVGQNYSERKVESVQDQQQVKNSPVRLEPSLKRTF